MNAFIAILLLVHSPSQSANVELASAGQVAMFASKPETQRVPLRVVNGSKAEVVVYSADFWSNHSLRLVDARGKPVMRTALGERVERAFPEFARGRNVPVSVPPGAHYAYRTPELARAFVLAPGEYTPTVVYKDFAGQPSGPPSSRLMKLATKPIRLVIQP
jgi:hypothetical protein